MKDFKEACAQPCKTLEQFEALEQRVRGMDRGWMLPMMMLMDDELWGRWDWWLRGYEHQQIPEGPMPQISFVSEGSTGYTQTQKMLEWCLDGIQCGSRRNALLFLIDWLAWSLALGETCPDGKDVDSNAAAILYQRFVLDMMMMHPYDHLGEALCVIEHGQGKGSNAFYPTPMTLTLMMGELQFKGLSWEDTKLKSAYDPTMGTGRTLLAASNHCLFLFGQDIDALVLKVAAINLRLYAPWGSLPLPQPKEGET